MDDLLSEFLTETSESLDTIDTELVRFESQPNDKETLNNIFRLVHTIKGTCGFLGLPRLEAVAHAGETLLGKFRDGALPVTPSAVTLVLESIDQIKSILEFLESSGAEPAGNDEELIARLEDASNGGLIAGAIVEEAPANDAEAVLAGLDDDEDEEDPNAPPPGIDPANWDAQLGRELRPGEVSLADLEAAFNSVEPDEIEQPAPVVAKVEAAAAAAPVAIEKASPLANQTIRVAVDVLEDLMTMVSELVLTRNQLMQMVRGLDDSEFKAPLQRLSAITAELQEGVMKTRMQPIGTAWKKLPRIVRDACQDLNKKIDLVLDGESTELDRQVLELIKDPLTHMIRNSCDHGVETPEARKSNGKPETGTIHLRAYHEGGHIIIEVADDGAGLNTQRIKEKAIEKEVVDAAEAANMTDAQIHRLIFAPGFSTAAKITNISGRGVGMDVVKTNIELIGGVIDLRAVEGEGTTFLIKIPLTLAIISALIVGVGEERFALPQLSVVELVRTGNERDQRVERISNTQVLRLRDRLLPLVTLNQILGLGDGAGSDVVDEDGNAFVVVMQVGDTRFGLVVDEVFDTEEIVVKPLTNMLSGLRQYSGATILGDGSVIMILDPNGVAKEVSSIEGASQANAASKAEDNINDDRMSLLLFRAGGDEPMACPLSLVTRLEDLDASTFEHAQGHQVVQYRGKLMPLVHAAGSHMIKSEGKQPILVFNQGDTVIGVAVDEILDIVHETVNYEMAEMTPGVLGAAVLKGKTTQIIDVAHFLNEGQRDWAKLATSMKQKQRRRVLLVETHPFFQNMLSPLLKAAGYDVTLAPTEDKAIEILKSEASFDAVLADIDASQGVSRLAVAIDANAQLISAPRFGLSNRDDAQPTEMGMSIPKADRQALLMALDTALKARGDAA
ncbi:chemotaxis protein CheW [Hirschia litorea]|uniref:histidine kinase n=1 Tax=Hirschia litorea TaxID=1199156 RepID=A0ABW2IMP6_9PROT